MWQPIETAPKGANGISFMLLAWGPDGDQSVGQGIRIGNKFYASGFFYCLGSKEKPYQIREMEVRPTHWMRAPELPENPINKAESNMPPLPDPVGMHAPAGPNGDKYPVWHHGQALDAIRAAVLKERQEIAEICDHVKEQRFASGNVREGSTARTLAEIIRKRT